MLTELNAVHIAGFGVNNRQQKGGAKSSFNMAVSSNRCRAIPTIIGPEFCVEGPEFIISDPLGLTDSCKGDSGAGVYVRTDEGELLAIGIVSRAITAEGDCGPGGVYLLTSEPSVLNWIKAVAPDVQIGRPSIAVSNAFTGIRISTLNREDTQ